MKPTEFALFPAEKHYLLKPDNLFWFVFICQNKKQMYRVFKKYNTRENDTRENFNAIVMPQTKLVLKGNKWQKLPFLGYVLFHKDALTSENISHEATHMAFGYLRYKRKMSAGDEIFCYTVGNCTRLLLKEMFNSGIKELIY